MTRADVTDNSLDEGARQACLELDEAVLLGHALCDALAKRRDLRVLAIKGPIQRYHGLALKPQSSDVDLLVHPADYRSFIEELGQAGWRSAREFSSPAIMPRHSATLSHALWPCELDVHSYFPGFLAEPEAVFEHLWARRVGIDLAHQRIEGCDAEASLLVAALHALRDGGDADLDALVSWADANLDSTGASELVELSAEVGALSTVGDFLARLAMVHSQLGGLAKGVAERDLGWELRRFTAGHGSAKWLLEMQRSRLWSWPSIAIRAVKLTPAEIEYLAPGSSTNWAAMQMARARRLWRGIRDVPAALRAIRRARGAIREKGER